MATLLQFSDVQDSLREAYSNGSTDDLLAKNHPLLGMIKRDRNFTETKKRIAIKYGNAQGAHSTLATAQTNAFAAKAEAFEVTTVNMYQVVYVEGKVLEQAQLAPNSDRFLKDLCDVLDQGMTEVTNRMGWQAYRASGGAVGTVGSGTSSPITMTNIEEVDALEVGMVIEANDGNNATTPRSGSGTITAIDYNTGIVTYTGTITSLAAGDYIFIQGFMGAAASGLEDWCPETAPGSTTFFGVDRSVNSRLGGTRIDCSTMPPEEVFARANARASRLPVKPDMWFMHPTDVANMEISLSSAKYTEVTSREYKFGYDAFSAYGAKIVPDTDCTRGVMWGVCLDHVELLSIGDAPKIFNADGNTMLRYYNDDKYEGRVGSRWQIDTDAPVLLVRVKIPT